MNEYTPSEAQLVHEHAWFSGGDNDGAYELAAEDARRAVAKIRADAIREARDELGVDVSDNDGEWWDGYRQGQRRQYMVLTEYARLIENGEGNE